MLVKCPECSGKIPDTSEVCPICGALLQTGSMVDPATEDSECPDDERKEPEGRFGKV